VASTARAPWMARSSARKEWVVRPERTTADGIREVTTAVGGAEGRRHREAWHPDRLLPPLDREPVDGRDLDGGARGLQASPVARAEHPRGVRSEYGAGLAVATEAGCGAALDAPITLSARGGLALRIPGAVMCTVDELCFVTYRYCTITLLYGTTGGGGTAYRLASLYGDRIRTVYRI